MLANQGQANAPLGSPERATLQTLLAQGHAVIEALNELHGLAGIVSPASPTLPGENSAEQGNPSLHTQMNETLVIALGMFTEMHRLIRALHEELCALQEKIVSA
jgi:hypothetical protein